MMKKQRPTLREWLIFRLIGSTPVACNLHVVGDVWYVGNAVMLAKGLRLQELTLLRESAPSPTAWTIPQAAGPDDSPGGGRFAPPAPRWAAWGHEIKRLAWSRWDPWESRHARRLVNLRNRLLEMLIGDASIMFNMGVPQGTEMTGPRAYANNVSVVNPVSGIGFSIRPKRPRTATPGTPGGNVFDDLLTRLDIDPDLFEPGPRDV